MPIRFLFITLVSILSFVHNSFGQDDYTLRHSIFFPGGQYYITYDQLLQLEQLIDSLYSESNFSVTIHSHTDNIGGVEFNDRLSKMRSYSTRKHLENFGVDDASMHIKDFGQHNPVYDNSTQEGRELNRRVDIIFWPLSL